ncbi:MAG: Gfo/Idh/MocA family oxidoreductase [Bdellovibrionales bacterium]|nr:Gfo/Idh/MocA family oxidoreductase [Bdellovibrionales bacterium]
MIRFALVGCGRISRKHAENLGEGRIQGARLTAVCDQNLERAEVWSKKYGVPAFKDMHEMMEMMGNEIDVISVLTPSGDHARHVIDLSKYKKNILVEKPMALTVDDAEKMISACNQSGVRLFVVKQNRFNLPVTKMREALESGRFGKLALGTVRVRWCRDQKYYDQDPWRGTWEHDGGVFANQAIHHVDLLNWAMGDVVSVFAKSATRLVNVEVEDTGVVVLKFENGALGIIEATTATRPKDLEGSISILGERGTVEIAGFAVNEMKIWNFVDSDDAERSEIEKLKQSPPDVYGFGHTEYLNHVVKTLCGEEAHFVDGTEGKKSLELVNAIYESIESGKEVFMKDRPHRSRLGHAVGSTPTKKSEI